MSPRTRKYLFGRVIAYGRTESKSELLRTLLTSQAELIPKSGDFGWGIFEVKFLEDEGRDFATGFLTKFSLEEATERVDRSTHTFTVEELRDQAIAKARFFLHLPSGLIAYHRGGSHIRDTRFRSVFARLLEEAHSNMFIEALVTPIMEPGDFFRKLQEFEEVATVRFTLHPTNPNFRPEYRKLDAKMKRIRADSYTEEYKAAPNESLQTEDPHISAGLTMASDGYGSGVVKGQSDGEEREIRTGDSPTTTAIPLTEDDPVSILERLRSAFDRIRNRTDAGGERAE